MYYLVESEQINVNDPAANKEVDTKADDSVIKLIDDDEREQINVNLPDESEMTTEEIPDENTEDTENADEEVAPTESKKYDLPKISHAKFEKVDAKNSPYDSLPGANYVILAHNITEGIEAVIHGSGYGIMVTTRNDVELFKNYYEAKKYVVRSVLSQHNDYLKRVNESKYNKHLKDIYESCGGANSAIKMILKENSLKVLYPSKRKSVTITYDKDNYQYVIETRVGKDVSTNAVSDNGIVLHSRDIIKSIIMGG